MARICYGVLGDSRGHVSRALAITQELSHHEFLFIGDGKVNILKAKGFQVENNVHTFKTIISNNQVNLTATLADYLKCAALIGPSVKRAMRLIKEFDPHLIISDYEFITPRAAKLMGLPCISLDNQHLMTECVYERPPGEYLSRLLTCCFIRYLFSSADHYLITSFHPLPPKDPSRIEVFPPLIKPKVLEYQAAAGDHVLVYLRGYDLQNLVKSLTGRKRQYVIYGLGEQPSKGNLQFKKGAEDDFLMDLATCDYVISNGGLSLITEALYFGKPLLCLPIQLFYEQFFNAYFLAQNGFGAYALNGRGLEDMINAFEDRLEHYRGQINKFNFFGNKLIALRLEELIAGLPGRLRRSDFPFKAPSVPPACRS